MAAARAARAEPAVLRMLAIAGGLGGSEPDLKATRLVGVERQALREAVVRDRAEGLAGLCDRPCAKRMQSIKQAAWRQPETLGAAWQGRAGGACRTNLPQSQSGSASSGPTFSPPSNPATGADVVLVLPEATTRTMSPFMAKVSRNLPNPTSAPVLT